MEVANLPGTRRIRHDQSNELPWLSAPNLPFARMTRGIDSSDGLIAACQQWIAANYANANPVQRMIERSGLSPRTFARRFRIATGYPAIDYVQALLIDEAKKLLETGGLAVEEVAAAIGYDEPASFRRLFKRIAGPTPAAYRRKVSSLI